MIRIILLVLLLISWSITLKLKIMSNNQNQKPIYVGSGVEKFDGDLIEVSVCLSDLPAEHRFEYNGKWYAKLKINRKRETDEYGKTHSVSINTWKPEPKQNEKQVATPVAQDDGDLPF